MSASKVGQPEMGQPSCKQFTVETASHQSAENMSNTSGFISSETKIYILVFSKQSVHAIGTILFGDVTALTMKQV